MDICQLGKLRERPSTVKVVTGVTMELLVTTC